MMPETLYRKKIVKKTQKDNFVTVFISKLGHFYLINAQELLKLCHFHLPLLYFQGIVYQKLSLLIPLIKPKNRLNSNN